MLKLEWLFGHFNFFSYLCIMKENFETIKQDNRLLYLYVRGSHCHGIATPMSDIDKGGIFIANKKASRGEAGNCGNVRERIRINLLFLHLTYI